ncbi:unnamed protein product [Ascophyllum nodosum]
MVLCPHCRETRSNARIPCTKRQCMCNNRPWCETPNIDTEVDINEFHCSFGHVHKELLLETAKQRGVTLTGELHECKGCSMAKDARSQSPRPPKVVQISVVAVSFSMFADRRVYDQ